MQDLLQVPKTNPAMPPITPETPMYPFQSVCADFFTIDSHNFLAIVDRFSNWLSIFKLDRDTSEEFLKVLRTYVAIFGIPITFTSDGAKVFTSKPVEDFCIRWGIIHRVTTAYNPRSNKRAEVAVKSAKRLIRDNLSQTGSLDTDSLARAILQHRNSPCPITGLSPAQIVFGRVLRDFLPLQPGKFIQRPEWQQAAETREKSYSKRILDKAVQLTKGSKQLPALKLGDHVHIQDQHGNTPKQWNKTGVIVEVGKYDDYLISIDGSRHVTKRNRKFLRQIKPAIDTWSAPASRVTLPAPTPTYPSPPFDSPAITNQGDEIPHDGAPSHRDEQDDLNVDVHEVPQPPRDEVPEAPRPKQVRKLPQHLRERWILATDLQQQSLPTPTLSPNSPVQPMISPIFPTPIQPAMAPFPGYPFYYPYQTSPYSPHMNVFPQTYSSYSTNLS